MRGREHPKKLGCETGTWRAGTWPRLPCKNLKCTQSSLPKKSALLKCGLVSASITFSTSIAITLRRVNSGISNTVRMMRSVKRC